MITPKSTRAFLLPILVLLALVAGLTTPAHGEEKPRLSPSGVASLGASPAATGGPGDYAPVLLVDDDNNNPDVRPYYTDALDALGVRYHTVETGNSDIEPEAATLGLYSTVIWFSGAASAYAGPGSYGETDLMSWLDGGGCLFLTSQGYLGAHGLTGFGEQYLGISNSFVNDVTQTTVAGQGDVFGGLGPYTLTFPSGYTNSTDYVPPAAGASLGYSGDGGEGDEYPDAGIQKDSGTFRTIFWGFPLDALPDLAARQANLARVLDWCGVFGPAISITPTRLTAELISGDAASLPLDIDNTGSANLAWDTGATSTPIPSQVVAPAALQSVTASVQAYGIDLKSDKLISFMTGSPGSLTVKGDVGGHDYLGGDFLGNDFSKIYVLDDTADQLLTISTANGSKTVIGSAVPSDSHGWTGLTGDPTTNTLYAVSTDSACSNTHVYKINPKTGQATYISTVAGGRCLIGLAASIFGELYSLDVVKDALYKVDKHTGATVKIGNVGFNAADNQSLDFDLSTNTLYLATYYSATNTTELRVVDITTGAATAKGSIGRQGTTQIDALSIAIAPCSGSTIPWAQISPISGSTPAGAGSTVNVNFNAAGVTPGKYSAALCVNSNDLDTPLVAVPLEMTVLAPQIDLGVAISAAPKPVSPDQALNYTVTVSNLSTHNTTGVKLTDTLPGGVTLISTSPTQGTCSTSGSTVTCSLGNLDAGKTAQVQIQVTVNSSTRGTLTNKASVSQDYTDPDLANNSATDDTSIYAPADLALSKTVTPASAYAGEDLIYTLTASNSGAYGAANVKITDPLPGGVTFKSATPTQGTCSASGGIVTCSLGNLDNGGSAQVQIKVGVSASTRGTLTNTASVSHDNTDPNAANNSATANASISAPADLELHMTVSPGSAYVGKDLTYTLTTSNNGPFSEANVNITDPLPAAVTLKSATPTQGTCSASGSTVTCSLGSLDSGETAQVVIRASLNSNAPPLVHNYAEVTGDESDPNPTNNAAGAEVKVISRGFILMPFMYSAYSPFMQGQWEIEPNGTYLQASGPLRPGLDYFGYPNDQKDYFKVFLYTRGDLIIDLINHVGSGVQLQVFYTNTSTRVDFDTSAPYHLELLDQPPGWYYIYIYTNAGFSSTSAYTLRVNYP